MSRRVVNSELKGFQRKGIKYDWKPKVGCYLPDQRSMVVSYILFMPLARQRGREAPTVRAMAWFSAAVSSGIPLVFINIQTDVIITSVSSLVPIFFKFCSQVKWSWNPSDTVFAKFMYICPFQGDESGDGRQQSINTTVNIVQGTRLWFLPCIQEVSLELIPEPGEVRFGMDIKRTEEVTIKFTTNQKFCILLRFEK